MTDQRKVKGGKPSAISRKIDWFESDCTLRGRNVPVLSDFSHKEVAMNGTRDIMVVPGEWHIRYQYAAGKVGTEFFRRLRDDAKIMATKCPKCDLVMLPPRGYCERCFVPAEEWVEVKDTGTIEACTIVTEQFEGLPKPPYAIAYVVLDGASTAMINFVSGVDLSDVREAAKILGIGRRVRVAFNKEREGKITDFHYELA